jgi:predicted ATPase
VIRINEKGEAMQATIETLKLRGVGPAPAMQFEFGPRLNLFTGDNGLGKTFLLDVAWWALTRTWAGNPALPFDQKRTSEIEFSLRGVSDSTTLKTVFDASVQAWKFPQGRPVKTGLVIYARVDGGFSVWDPARNYWRPRNSEQSTDDEIQPEPFHFSTETLWNGLEKEDGKVICNGLLRDWVSWQLKQNKAFKSLDKVLAGLKPEEFDVWEIGEPERFSPDDVRDIPTLKLPYGRIPVTHASAGVRRILSFAYLLVWALSEHREAARLRKESPTDRLIVLFDEVESHLHPRWQRLFLPALIDILCGEGAISNRQLLVSTHSPLVAASVETKFEKSLDRLFTFDLEGSTVSAREIPWAKQGDVVNWLVSDSFGLRQARSKDAEEAIETAEKWMREDYENLTKGMQTEGEIHQELLRVLADHDTFWPRWIVGREAHQE